jgi:polyisoprenoid-binding protein YceI
VSRMAAFLGIVLGSVSSVYAQDGGRELHVDLAASRIYVVTYRTGLLSFLGHEHAILANDWQAAVCYDAPQHLQSRASFSVNSATLTIDADSARQLAGLGRGPSANQRTQIQAKMLANLDVANHPALAFSSDSLRMRNSRATLYGRLTIKGKTNPVDVPLVIREADGALTINGKTSFRQSAFGIRPESIAGVVKVSDRVDLFIQLNGALSRGTCRS